MNQIQYAVASPVGRLYLVASSGTLEGAFFNKQKIKLVSALNTADPSQKVLVKAAKQLEEYFKGQRASFDLPLGLTGTEFQLKVWIELAKIPFGTTVSYKDIAKRIKNPKAVRAVGSANGKNPICIIVPCHRVIAADGSIGGYSGGLSIKKKLLSLEGFLLKGR